MKHTQSHFNSVISNTDRILLELENKTKVETDQLKSDIEELSKKLKNALDIIGRQELELEESRKWKEAIKGDDDVQKKQKEALLTLGYETDPTRRAELSAKLASIQIPRLDQAIQVKESLLHLPSGSLGQKEEELRSRITQEKKLRGQAEFLFTLNQLTIGQDGPIVLSVAEALALPPKPDHKVSCEAIASIKDTGMMTEANIYLHTQQIHQAVELLRGESDPEARRALNYEKYELEQEIDRLKQEMKDIGYTPQVKEGQDGSWTHAEPQEHILKLEQENEALKLQLEEAREKVRVFETEQELQQQAVIDYFEGLCMEEVPELDSEEEEEMDEETLARNQIPRDANRFYEQLQRGETAPRKIIVAEETDSVTEHEIPTAHSNASSVDSDGWNELDQA